MIAHLLLLTTLWANPPKPRIVQHRFPAREHRDTSVNFIVFHYDSGSTPRSTFRYLRKKRASYNYYIARDGTIYKLVDPAYKANHAGVSLYNGYLGMNKYSIGICFQNKYPQAYTMDQYTSAAWLVSVLYRRFPSARHHPLLGHSDIAFPRGRKSDPGDHFSWPTLQSLIP